MKRILKPTNLKLISRSKSGNSEQNLADDSSRPSMTSKSLHKDKPENPDIKYSQKQKDQIKKAYIAGNEFSYNLALDHVLKERENWIEEFIKSKKKHVGSWMAFEKFKIEGLRK